MKKILSILLAVVVLFAMGTMALTAVSAETETLEVATEKIAVGDTFEYTIDLTAARLFENIQAVITYDSEKVELVRIQSDDPDVADWEVEGPVRCPNLDGVIFNAGTAGLVKFNASKVAGYNFKNEAKTLVNLEFKAISAGTTDITAVIEEMTIKGDGTESYFTGGQAVITEGITVAEYITYVPVTTTTATTSENTTVTTTEEITTVTTTKEITTVTTTEEITTTIPGPSTNPPVVTGTTATGSATTPPTGAAAYIYIAVAVMAMVACAVVVLRKKAND